VQYRPTLRPTVILLACLAFPAPAAAETVTLGALKDNTLYEDGSGSLSNGSGSYLFAGRTNQDAGISRRRALLAFDVASQIPAGASITAVQLTLHLSRTISGAQSLSVHRVLSDWGEGTSDATFRGEGRGESAADKDATWLHRFFPTQTWSTPGGDFSSTASATLSVGGIGPYTWAGTGLVADVQAWIDGTAANFGWLLRGNEASAITAKRFDSREIATASFRPQLIVTYVGTATQDHTWSSVKSFYR